MLFGEAIIIIIFRGYCLSPYLSLGYSLTV